MSGGHSAKLRPERRYDLDWLRVTAMFSVFLYHCSRFFDYDWWRVKNAELSYEASVFCLLLGQWIMPLFFVLSGASTYYMLCARTGRRFVDERFRRLMIPLIFGVFVIAPPEVYLERLSYSQFSGSFAQFYPHYFEGLYGFGGDFAWMGIFFPVRSSDPPVKGS